VNGNDRLAAPATQLSDHAVADLQLVLDGVVRQLADRCRRGPGECLRRGRIQ
jgi:hypothetical protein